MCKLVPCEIHISAQDTQVTPDTDLTLGYSWRVGGHEGHTQEIFLSLQHRHSCSRLCSLTQYLNHCAATNSARWSKLILLTKSYTGWESGMDFPNQHSYWVQDKRSNTKEWLGLGKRREENRAAPLFLAAAQSSEINQNTSPHSSYSPHSSRRKKKKAGVICSLTGSTSWNFQNLLQHIFDRAGQTLTREDANKFLVDFVSLTYGVPKITTLQNLAEGDDNTAQDGSQTATYLPLFLMLHDVKSN